MTSQQILTTALAMAGGMDNAAIQATLKADGLTEKQIYWCMEAAKLSYERAGKAAILLDKAFNWKVD